MSNSIKTKIILLSIGLALVLLITVGATYTYFAARVSGDDGNIVTIQAASEGTVVESMGVETDVTLTTEGIYPSDNAWLTKEVSIYSVGTAKAEGKYNFNLIVNSNTFENGDIKYLFTLVDNSNSNGNTQTSITRADNVNGTKHDIAKSSTTQTYNNIGSGIVANGTKFNVTFKLELFYVNNPNVNQNYEEPRSLQCYIVAHYSDNGNEESANLLSFKINNATYYADPNMTWNEWIESNYNTGNFCTNCSYLSYLRSYIVQGDGNMSTIYLIKDANDFVSNNSLIINNYNYHLGPYDQTSGGCFIAGTQVQYTLTGKTKNIEDFNVGDEVVSYDIKTNKYYLAQVSEVQKHGIVTNIYDLELTNGLKVSVTDNHPILTKDGFKTISGVDFKQLNLLDTIKTIKGDTTIKKLTKHTLNEKVYNLNVKDYDEVEDINTFDIYIANGLLVHNKPS